MCGLSCGVYVGMCASAGVSLPGCNMILDLACVGLCDLHVARLLSASVFYHVFIVRQEMLALQASSAAVLCADGLAGTDGRWGWKMPC